MKYSLPYINFFCLTVVLSVGCDVLSASPLGNPQAAVRTSFDNALDASIYRSLFRRALNYQSIADDPTTSVYRSAYFQNILGEQLGLSDVQQIKLAIVSSEYQSDAEAIQEQIRAVVADFRIRVQRAISSKLPIPPPPAELEVLEAKRASVALRYKDILQSEFGNEEFVRIDRIVRQLFGTSESGVQHNQANSPVGRGPR